MAMRTRLAHVGKNLTTEATPTWWPLLQALLAFGFAGFLLFSLVGSSDEPPATAGDTGTVTFSATDGRDDAADSDNRPAFDPRPGAAAADRDAGGDAHSGSGDGAGSVRPPPDTVELRTVAGELATVDAAAVALADTFAFGLLSGDVTDVPFATGTTPPSVATTFNDPQVGEPSVAQADGDVLVLVVPTDPDPDGPSPERDLTVRLVVEDGEWVVVGDRP